jgi:hypothetical protein
MPKNHSAKLSEIDPASILVTFSPEVREAFRSLSAAVHFSQHFDPDIRHILDDLAEGKPKSIYGILVSYPAIAGETARHIRDTNDKRAEEALSEISVRMVDHGFTLTKDRKVAKN